MSNESVKEGPEKRRPSDLEVGDVRTQNTIPGEQDGSEREAEEDSRSMMREETKGEIREILEGGYEGGFEGDVESDFERQNIHRKGETHKKDDKGSATNKEGENLPKTNTAYVSYLEWLSKNWSSCHAARLLNKNLITYIGPRFLDCSTPLKVRILTSFLYIKDSLRTEAQQELLQILELGETDRDDWVRKLSRMLTPYVRHGSIDLRETDTETAFRIVDYLDSHKPIEKEYEVKPPLEHIHMCDPVVELPKLLAEMRGGVPQSSLCLLDSVCDPVRSGVRIPPSRGFPYAPVLPEGLQDDRRTSVSYFDVSITYEEDYNNFTPKKKFASVLDPAIRRAKKAMVAHMREHEMCLASESRKLKQTNSAAPYFEKPPGPKRGVKKTKNIPIRFHKTINKQNPVPQPPLITAKGEMDKNEAK